MFGISKLIHLVKLRNRGDELYDLASDAEADPRLYRDPQWWEKVLRTAAAFLALIPLATKERQTMANWMQKIVMIAGLVATAAGALNGAPGLPPKAQGIVAIIGSFAAMIAGLYHPQPGTPTDQPAK